MEWLNPLQATIAEEWAEGVREDSSPEAKRKLQKRLGKKYNLSVYVIAGIVELAATEGLARVKKEGLRKASPEHEPINYHRLVQGLREDVEDLKRKFDYLCGGVQRVLDNGAEFGIHLQQLKMIAKRANDRKTIDLGEWPQLPE